MIPTQMAVAKRGKLWKLPREWKSGKTNCMFSHFPTSAWKTRRKKAATSFPQFPQLLLLVLLPKKEKKECDISNELKHVTFLKSFDTQKAVGLTPIRALLTISAPFRLQANDDG